MPSSKGPSGPNDEGSEAAVDIIQSGKIAERVTGCHNRIVAQQPPQDDDWIFDPSLAAINRSIYREFRDEAEEVESIVHESDLRARDMADIALEHRNRGDYVTVATPYREFNGFVVYAAGNFLTLRSEETEVDIALAHIIFFKLMPLQNRRDRGGRPALDGPGTFEMRLVERKGPYDRLEVGFADRQDSLVGILTATGQDHVIVTDDERSEWTIPYTAIAYVARAPRRMR